jgi:hypothetical protein
MKKGIDLKLQVFRDFQLQNPTAHLGGSLGLMLRGIDLQRDLISSDLDVTIDEYEVKNLEVDRLDLTSEGNDFDFCTSKVINEEGLYVKMDLRVNPEPSFDKIEFEDFTYNVSKLRDILFWKKSYAKKGVLKHINDLVTIETGVRPAEVTNDNWF